MLEAYAVGVTLELGGNVQAGIERIMEQMDALDSRVKGTADLFSKLAADIRSLGNAGRSVNQLNRAMERLGSSGAGQAVNDLDRMATATRTMLTESQELTAALRDNSRLMADTAKAAEAAARASSGFGRGAGGSGGGGGGGAGSPGGRGRASGGHGGSFSGHDAMMLGMGASMVGEPLVQAGETAFDRGLEMAHLRTQILADQRVSAAQADAMVNAAYAASMSAPGTSPIQNMEAGIDLKNITGSLEEAQKMLPAFAQLSSLLALMDRRRGGSGDPTFAAAKAEEIMGGMMDEHTDASGHTVREINPGLLQQRLDMMSRVAVATNGRVGPQDFLGMAKNARVAGMTLSDEFIYEKLPGIMLALGGPRTGTALMSMAQVFRGGKLEAKSMAALQEIGLAGPEGLQTHVGGHRNRRGEMVGGHTEVHPEAIYDLDMMMHDPQKYLEAAQKRMEAAGIHGSEAQITALMNASQRSTIAGFFADLLKDMPAILKEQQNITNTRPNVASYFAEQDPAAKLQQMQAAMDKLVTTLGSSMMDDAVKLMNAATGGLNAIGDWAKAHPTTAKVLTETGIALGTLAVGISTLSMAVFLFGPGLKLLGGTGEALKGLGGGLGTLASRALPFGAGGQAAAGLAGAASGLMALAGAAVVAAAIGPAFNALRHALGFEDVAHTNAGRFAHGGVAAPSGSGSGNEFWDGITHWWQGATSTPAPPAPGTRGNTRGGHQLDGQQHSSLTSPAPKTQLAVNTHITVDLDGRTIAQAVSRQLAREGSGPSTGTTGPDIKVGLFGGNAGALG